jgi:hypothetical protein
MTDSKVAMYLVHRRDQIISRPGGLTVEQLAQLVMRLDKLELASHGRAATRL